MSWKIGCAIAAVALSVIGTVSYYSRLDWIDAGEVGLIYNPGGVQDKVYDPQCLYVGFLQKLYKYPTKMQMAIYTQDPTMGEQKSADGISITTNDTANTTFDIVVMYRIEKQNVRKVFDTFGAISIEDVQALHIRRAVKEGANAIGNQYDIFQLLGKSREEASNKLTQELSNILGTKGITIVQAMFCQAHPTEENQKKIIGRVNSYTLLEIAKLQTQLAEITRQIAVVLGTADNQARTLTAGQTSDKSIEMLELELTQKAIEKWNGNVPRIAIGPGSQVYLGGGIAQAQK